MPSNFTAVDTFSNVELIETTEQVLGGSNIAPSNKQAQALVNRTQWLRKRIGSKEVVTVTLEAMTNLTLTSYIGKFVIVDTAPNTVRDFNIVISSPNWENGNSVLVYFKPNDTTLLIGTTNGSVRYFSGDLVEFVYDGTSFVGSIIHRDLATGMPPVDGFISGAHVGLTLPTISNNYYIPAISLGDITRMQLQGENYPNVGTVIRLYNISGTPRILRQLTSTVEGEFIIYSGVQYDSVTDLRYVLEEGEYADFRLSNGNLWYLIEKDISEVPLNGIVPNGNIALSAATYPSLRNWLNKIIERVEFPEVVFKTTTSNGVAMSVNVTGAGPFTFTAFAPFYSYVIKNKICTLNFNITFDVFDGADIDLIRIPLPTGVIKDITDGESYSNYGIFFFKALPSTSDYGSGIIQSIGDGSEGQTLELRRSESGNILSISTGASVSLKGIISFKVV